MFGVLHSCLKIGNECSWWSLKQKLVLKLRVNIHVVPLANVRSESEGIGVGLLMRGFGPLGFKTMFYENILLLCNKSLTF